MTENETVQQEGTLGVIDISTTAVTTIASQAINQCYGVVGMANKNLANGIANLLSRDSKRGIDVAIEHGEITVGVYVIVEYGVNIRAVAESIQHTVKFHVEKALNMPVNAVNVYVQGLRMGKENT
ncbi:MAG: Asp23/Gls24 family envelope stress response protein [Candidatus Promineifilaceae bacterium]|nr:Asp23/Gls24 family envelope stress response protein [Anaerolineaceae bacterium]